MDDSKTSAPGSAEPQLRNACLSFWSGKAELGLHGPRREGPIFLKIWYYTPFEKPKIENEGPTLKRKDI